MGEWFLERVVGFDIIFFNPLFLLLPIFFRCKVPEPRGETIVNHLVLQPLHFGTSLWGFLWSFFFATIEELIDPLDLKWLMVLARHRGGKRTARQWLVVARCC